MAVKVSGPLSGFTHSGLPAPPVLVQPASTSVAVYNQYANPFSYVPSSESAFATSSSIEVGQVDALPLLWDGNNNILDDWDAFFVDVGNSTRLDADVGAFPTAQQILQPKPKPVRQGVSLAEICKWLLRLG